MRPAGASRRGERGFRATVARGSSVAGHRRPGTPGVVDRNHRLGIQQLGAGLKEHARRSSCSGRRPSLFRPLRLAATHAPGSCRGSSSTSSRSQCSIGTSRQRTSGGSSMRSRTTSCGGGIRRASVRSSTRSSPRCGKHSALPRSLPRVEPQAARGNHAPRRCGQRRSARGHPGLPPAALRGRRALADAHHRARTQLAAARLPAGIPGVRSLLHSACNEPGSELPGAGWKPIVCYHPNDLCARVICPLELLLRGRSQLLVRPTNQIAKHQWRRCATWKAPPEI